MREELGGLALGGHSKLRFFLLLLKLRLGGALLLRLLAAAAAESLTEVLELLLTRDHSFWHELRGSGLEVNTIAERIISGSSLILLLLGGNILLHRWEITGAKGLILVLHLALEHVGLLLVVPGAELDILLLII